MLIFSVTKPKKKIKCVVTALCLILLLGVGVPATYNYLKDEDAMAGFAGTLGDNQTLYVTDAAAGEDLDELNTADIEINNMTGDPIKVNAEDETKSKSANQTDSEDAASEENNGTDENEQVPSADDKAVRNEERGFWQKVLAVIFGEGNEIIYYNVE